MQTGQTQRFTRVATVREKYLENEILGKGKVREFCGWSGKFRKDFEVREKSGNLKINGYARQSSENVFILFKREKGVLSHEIVWAHLPSHRGLLLK